MITRFVCSVLLMIAGCTPSVPPYKNLADGASGVAPGSAPLSPALAVSSSATDTTPVLPLDQFRPIPRLVVEEHLLTAAKFPCIDVHMHPQVRLRGSTQMLDDYVALMDEQNIALSVSLDGGLGEAFDEHVRFVWTKHRERFLIFANIDWRGDGREDDPATWDMQRPDFGRRMAAALEKAQAKGASGLKLLKEFGLKHRNADGSTVAIDDPRWDPIWEACGRLGLPVIMHTADPSAFFLPIDETNERWEELYRHPEWSFHDPKFPRREELLAARNRVIARHRQTTFIAAHVANDGENLAEVGRWLDEHPNLVTEIAARIAELGRQPYTAREFFIKYADRIMFGTDGPRVRQRLLYHWRFLESRDEFFPYAENAFPPQGFWRIYGVNLPDDVLRKVYFENALRIIPGAKEKYTAWTDRR